MGDWTVRFRKFRRRVRLARAWQGLATGGAAGAALSAVWAVLDWRGVYFTEWLWMGVLVGICALVGATVGWLLPVPERALGDSIDRRADLKNRLATALAEPEGADDFVEAQKADAQRRLVGVSPASVYPLKFGKRHWALLGLCGLAAGLFLMGNTPLLLGDKAKRERSDLQGAAQQIERVAKPLTEEDVTSPEIRDVGNELQKLARELRKGRLDKAEALQKAEELTKKADELSRKQYSEADRLVSEGETALDKALKSELAEKGLEGVDPSELQRSEAENQKAREDLQKKIGDLEKQLGDPNKSQADKDAIKAKLDQARKDLQKLELSEKARKTFEKLFNMKEYQELQKLAAKLKSATQSGKQGRDKLTPEQIKEMQKRLEELAAKLKDEKAMRDYIQKLREAMKKSQGG